MVNVWIKEGVFGTERASHSHCLLNPVLILRTPSLKKLGQSRYYKESHKMAFKVWIKMRVLGREGRSESLLTEPCVDTAIGTFPVTHEVGTPVTEKFGRKWSYLRKSCSFGSISKKMVKRTHVEIIRGSGYRMKTISAKRAPSKRFLVNKLKTIFCWQFLSEYLFFSR